jgi:MoaA/NifB/PqqE/SkfB family radical SAM enzyme
MVKVDFKGMKYTISAIRKQMIHLNLQLLYQCNFRCKICDFWKEDYKDYHQLSISQIKIIEEKINEIGPLIISLGGGEPLLHKDIISIIKILSKNHYPVMISNGWYITKENAKELFDAGLYEVSVSIDYIDHKKHDMQRGKEGAFSKAVEALKILKDVRNKPYQRVHLISVVMEDNLMDIEPLILLAKEIGITYLVTLYSDGRGKKDNFVGNEDISKYLLGLKEKYKEFVALPGYLSKFTESVNGNQEMTPCCAGKNLFNIGSNGDVSLCIDRLDNPVANIFIDNMSSISEKLLAAQQSNTCGNCWTSCRGAIESLLYHPHKLSNIKAMYESIKNVPVGVSNL